jgi:hypothetical protein
MGPRDSYICLIPKPLDTIPSFTDDHFDTDVNPEPSADLTVAEQNAQAANLELARGAGSRYLVQKWGDGTICDKTGKSREVEVQVS